MKITIFGATGQGGSRTVAEALSRGHEVTAVIRDPAGAEELPKSVTAQQGDATNADDVAELSAGQDLVISATRPAPGRESELVETTRALLNGVGRTGVRLLLVGGAGSLIVPGTDGTMAVDDPRFVPAAWRDIAQACVAQYEVCRAETQADWTYLSPPALLTPGNRSGRCRLGTDTLLVDADGRSAISMEDFAVALLDEAEHRRHRRQRFTVAY